MLDWQWDNYEAIKYITLPEWKKQGVNMLFTSRCTGSSSAPYNSLNLALHVGDEAEGVIENRKKLMKIWGKSIADMVCCEQVHGNQVAAVDNLYKGRGALEYNTALPGYDAMITDTPGLFLALFYADCLPIFLFDPIKKVIAMIHSGWKGTMGKIVCQTVESMKNNYQVKPEDIQAFIGPGISRCCFEISLELAEKVKKEFASFDNILFYNNGHYNWDLAATNNDLLVSAGLLKNNISICNLCTTCDTDNFFSYRGEGGSTGRMAAVIGLE